MISYSPQQLVLQTGLGDSEVDDGHFDTHLRQVVRVGELGRHIEPVQDEIERET